MHPDLALEVVTKNARNRDQKIFRKIEDAYIYLLSERENIGLHPSVFLPGSLWWPILKFTAQPSQTRLDLNQTRDPYYESGVFAMLLTWRYTRGIYKIDEAIFDSLISTPLTGIIPVEVMLRLPEWCIYIDFKNKPITIDGSFRWNNGMGGAIKGVWVSILTKLDSVKQDDLSLCMVANRHHDDPTALATSFVSIILKPGKPIDELLTLTQDPFIDTHERKIIEKEFRCIIPLVLFICSNTQGISESKPVLPSPVKTKRGPRLFPAPKTRTWIYGKNIGDKMREHKERGHLTTNKKTPHIRRAHWHGYYSGKGKVDFNYKWLLPIFVGDTDV